MTSRSAIFSGVIYLLLSHSCVAQQSQGVAFPTNEKGRIRIDAQGGTRVLEFPEGTEITFPGNNRYRVDKNGWLVRIGFEPSIIYDGVERARRTDLYNAMKINAGKKSSIFKMVYDLPQEALDRLLKSEKHFKKQSDGTYDLDDFLMMQGVARLPRSSAILDVQEKTLTLRDSGNNLSLISLFFEPILPIEYEPDRP